MKDIMYLRVEDKEGMILSIVDGEGTIQYEGRVNRKDLDEWMAHGLNTPIERGANSHGRVIDSKDLSPKEKKIAWLLSVGVVVPADIIEDDLYIVYKAAKELILFSHYSGGTFQYDKPVETCMEKNVVTNFVVQDTNENRITWLRWMQEHEQELKDKGITDLPLFIK